jgi:PKD repeat protein
VRYAWDYGDGGAGVGETTTHTYIAVGLYAVRLTATDAEGRTAVFTSTEVQIGGQPAPLNAVNQQPQATANPREYRFIVTVAGGIAPYTFNWDFGDGTTSVEQNPVHQYASEGIYPIVVVVTDNIGEVIESGERIVDCRTIALDADTLAGQRELDVDFDVDARVGGGNPSRITIDFGDGAEPEVLSDYTDSDPTLAVQVPHTYLFVGTYTVEITAETIFRGDIYEISDNVTVVVGFGTPVIESLTPTQGIAGDIVTINGRFFEDGTNGVVRWNGADFASLSWSDNQITFVVPDSSTDGAVTVVNEGLESTPTQFKVLPGEPDWGGGGLGQL